MVVLGGGAVSYERGTPVQSGLERVLGQDVSSGHAKHRSRSAHDTEPLLCGTAAFSLLLLSYRYKSYQVLEP